MHINNFLIILARLVFTFFLGGLVGYQRERSERPAGFRTHVLVAVGAAVFTIVSIAPFSESAGVADPSRIASQVVMGIGFIGAGAIINQGDIIIGLTTAASLWATAAIGMAAGAGYYILAATTAALVYLALSVFKFVEKKLGPTSEHGMVYVQIKDGRASFEEIENIMKDISIRAKDFEFLKEKGISEHRYFVELSSSDSKEQLIDNIISVDGVIKARWEGMLTGRV